MIPSEYEDRSSTSVADILRVLLEVLFVALVKGSSHVGQATTELLAHAPRRTKSTRGVTCMPPI